MWLSRIQLTDHENVNPGVHVGQDVTQGQSTKGARENAWKGFPATRSILRPRRGTLSENTIPPPWKVFCAFINPALDENNINDVQKPLFQKGDQSPPKKLPQVKNVLNNTQNPTPPGSGVVPGKSTNPPNRRLFKMEVRGCTQGTTPRRLDLLAQKSSRHSLRKAKIFALPELF
ncbi:hypothetical protein GWK47_038863 [Chionoecetes opilio]|uniref:Uncharacterized protein n=1 Tax=Chionoecetes opilio TaxID=41210 RepID=A0A8J5D1M2_CHIOP|nr:hypothetical protein GWK47_038863 [Chionoecetes opilio]